MRLLSRLRHKFSLLSNSGYRDGNLASSTSFINQATEWGYCDKIWTGSPKILIAAGHGYGNVGDEAQLGACISRWRRVYPNCKITLFSPNPSYTSALHQEHCVWAPRVAWFRSNTVGPYDGESSRYFKFFSRLRFRLILSAYLLRLGLPIIACWPREAAILSELVSHDCLHVSGGGYLTGATRSRLWENCLLMRLCQILAIPYFLTGHNIGVLKSTADQRITEWGLKGAKYISLRDKGVSESVLASIGLKGDHIHSTCDDALLCDRYGDEDIRAYLDRLGGAPSAWAVVNFHHWGMPDSEIEVNEKRFSTLCDYISTKYNVCCLLVSMAPSDVLPCVNISRRMSQESMVVPYSPDYRVARSLIASAKFCFTMKHHPIVFAIGESTPVVSVCLDDYYNLKNKGVMDNIGYGHNAAVKEEFFTSAIYSLIDAAIASREDFQASCAEYVRQQQSLELEPYQEAALYLPS